MTISGHMRSHSAPLEPDGLDDIGVHVHFEGPSGEATMEVYHEDQTHDQRVMFGDGINNVDLPWSQFNLLMHALVTRQSYTRPCEHKTMQLHQMTKRYEISELQADGSVFGFGLEPDEEIELVTAYYCPECKRYWEAHDQGLGTYSRGEETTLWNLQVKFMVEAMRHVSDGWPQEDELVGYIIPMSFDDLVSQLADMRERVPED